MIKVVERAELASLWDEKVEFNILICLQTKEGLKFVVNLPKANERITVERKDNLLRYTIETIAIVKLYKVFTYKVIPDKDTDNIPIKDTAKGTVIIYNYKKGKNNE